MRRWPIFLIVIAIILPVFASPKNQHKDHIVVKTEIHCFKLQTLTAELRDKYGEEPIFLGKSDIEGDSVTTVFVNQDTGSYTVVGIGNGVGCIYDVGADMRYRMPKILENKLL
jgi:hypothetical protein